MATYKCDACKLVRESFVGLGGTPHACNGDGLVLGHWREIADKPAPVAHSFKFGDRVRFVRGLPGAAVGTIGVVVGGVIDVNFPTTKVAFVDPGGVSRAFTLGPDTDVYNLDAIEHIDAAPAPAPSATALAPIHDGTLGYTRAAWEEREAAHAREMAALRMRLDAETKRANRFADECGMLRAGKARVETERDRAQAELLRTRRRR